MWSGRLINVACKFYYNIEHVKSVLVMQRVMIAIRLKEYTMNSELEMTIFLTSNDIWHGDENLT